MSGPTIPPNFVWTGNTAFDTGSSPIPIPVGVVLGQLLIIQFNYFNNQTPGVVSLATWTQLATPSTAYQFFWFYKFVDSTDVANAGSGSWLMTESDGFVLNWAGAMYGNVDTTTPFKAGPTPTGAVGNGSINYSGAPLTGGTNDVYIMMLSIESNSGANPITSQPAGMTLEARGLNAFGDGDSLIYDQLITGASGTPTGTHTVGDWATVTMVLNPASSAPGGAAANVIGYHYIA